MRLAPALITLAAVLAGCSVHPDVSGTHWVRPDAMLQDITLDEVDCARRADQAGATPDLVVGGLVDVVRLVNEDGQRRTAFRQCMADRGYQPAGS
jgi:hypothetical protein